MANSIDTDLKLWREKVFLKHKNKDLTSGDVAALFNDKVCLS